MIRECFDLKEKIFGKWKVLSQVPCPSYLKSNITKAHWLCKCECGHKSIIRGAILRSGRSQSCGCQTVYDNYNMRRLRKNGSNSAE